jgi:hypothetical protein
VQQKYSPQKARIFGSHITYWEAGVGWFGCG